MLQLILNSKSNWLIGMLLVSRFELVEENAVKLFHHYVFHLLSYFLDAKFQILSEEIIIACIPISFPHLHAL